MACDLIWFYKAKNGLRRLGAVFQNFNKCAEPLQALIELYKTKPNRSVARFGLSNVWGRIRLDKRGKGIVFARDDSVVIGSKL